MKQFLYFVGIISALLGMQACTDNALMEHEDAIMTRALVDGNHWENLEYVILNTIDADETLNRVTLPWSAGAQTLLPSDFRSDVKKRDGWKMLFHTFADRGLDAGCNYMFFYNQLTGYIKVFYFYEGENNLSGAQWFIQTDGEKMKMFDQTEYLSRPINEVAKNDIILLSNAIKSPIEGFCTGWNGFEFQVPYSQDYQGKEIYIGAYGRVIGSFDLTGKEVIESTTTTASMTNQTSSTVETVFTVENKQADTYVAKLSDYAQLGGEVATAVASAGQTGTPSALSSGADKAFSSTTTFTTNTSSSTSNQTVKLNTTGTITLGGTLTFETGAGISPVSVNLYDVLNSSNETQSTNNQSLVYAAANTTGHNLGIWNLESAAEVFYTRVPRIAGVRYQKVYGSSACSVYGSVPAPIVQEYKTDVVFNPDIEPYIKSKSVEAKYILCDKLDGETYKKGVRDYLRLDEKNFLYSDDKNTFYSTKQQQWDLPIHPTLETQPVEGTPLYFDWGEVLDDRFLAVVTVDVIFDYEGSEHRLTQSRVYPVKSVIHPMNAEWVETYHNPPSSIVVNYGKPYYQEYSYWPNK